MAQVPSNKNQNLMVANRDELDIASTNEITDPSKFLKSSCVFDATFTTVQANIHDDNQSKFEANGITTGNQIFLHAEPNKSSNREVDSKKRKKEATAHDTFKKISLGRGVTMQPGYSVSNYLSIAVLDPRPVNMPPILRINADTRVHGATGTWTEFRNSLAVGQEFVILDYISDGRTVIDGLPPRNDALLIEARLVSWRPPMKTHLTIVMDRQYYPDPYKLTLVRLRSSMKNFITAARGTTKTGTLFKIDYVVMPPGTRYILNNLIFVPPEATAPIEGIKYSTVKQDIVTCPYNVNSDGIIEGQKTTRLQNDTPEDWRFLGELFRLNKIATRCNVGTKRDLATITTTKHYWSSQDGLAVVTYKAPQQTLRAITELCVTGAVIIVKKIDSNRRGDKFLMQILECKLKRCEKIAEIKATCLLKDVLKKHQIREIKQIEGMELKFSPILGETVTTELISSLINQSNSLIDPLCSHPVRPIFAAVCGLPIAELPNKIIDEPIYDAHLTSDQLEAAHAFFDPRNSIVICEAPAGSGKTTTIVGIIKAACGLRQFGAHQLPMVTASTNLAVVHVVQVLANNGLIPLLFCSKTFTARLSLQDEDINKFMLVSHLRQLLLKRNADMSREMIEIIEDAIMEEDYQVQQTRQRIFGDPTLCDDVNQEDIDIMALAEELELLGLEELKASTEKKSVRKKAIDILFALEPPSVVAATTATAVNIAKDVGKHISSVIIDEASTTSQINIAALLSATVNATKLMLVGDSKQLPPFVRDVPDLCQSMGSESILKVLQQNKGGGIVCCVLETVFRFHPKMLPMINDVVYNIHRLHTPIRCEERPFSTKIFDKEPILWLDTEGNEHQTYPTSSSNRYQTEAAVKLVYQLSQHSSGQTIAVLCLYKGQGNEITMALKEVDLDTKAKVATVHSFQGDEADFIILVTTKTNHIKKNSFLETKEPRNVAITRARCGLIIVGNKDAMEQVYAWKSIINYVECKRLIISKLEKSSIDPYAEQAAITAKNEYIIMDNVNV